ALRLVKGWAADRQKKLIEEEPLPEDIQAMQNTILNSFYHYKPDFYPGKVVLFRASDQPLGIYPDPTLGWGDLVADLEIHEYVGEHETVEDASRIQNITEIFKPLLKQTQLAYEKMK
ncbi:MAG: hypothetical protein AAF485_03460, partial [Chloroflexota bacterium]